MRRILIILLCLVIVLAGAEFVLRRVADHRIAAATACALGERPHGSIHASAQGFPLTWSVVRGHLPRADISTKVDGAGVRVRLDDVAFRHGLSAHSATVEASVPWSVVREQLPADIAQQYGDIQLAADGELLGVTVSVAGAPVRLDYAIAASDGKVVLTPEKAVVGGLDVPVGLVRTVTGGAFDEALKTREVSPELPLPADLVSASTASDGLRLHLTLGAAALARFARCA